VQTIPASEPLAQSAWDKLREGDAPTPEELQALETVIRLLRPAPLSHAGNLDDLPDQQGRNLYPEELKDQWSRFRASVKPLLYSIGRIDSQDGKHIGTGFLVADGVLATNRHVLADLTFGTEVLTPGRAKVIFQREDGETDKPEHIVDIRGVIGIHESLDMALLAVPKLGRPVVEIDSKPVSEGDRVAAIGYPAEDEARNPLFVGLIFKNIFGRKRAAIGEVLDGTNTPNLFHDCSTLGGNSGSPVFALNTGNAVGIHRAGFFMYRNEAVDGLSLNSFVTSLPKNREEQHG
jgi:S1-C subfamily serine protease